MNQGNRAVAQSKEAAVQEKPKEAVESRKDKLAENRIQADARDVELNAQLDQPAADEQKPRENNIIAVLIS